ncbi:MAG TPA: PAS domain S-box protein, partial [Gemmataceae bacterium]|nr:PAS domain S-box protein [Gemmataceae bacterium]
MQHSLNLLAIADHASSVEHVLHDLREVGFEPDWKQVADECSFLQRLKPQLELILAFHGMTGFNAFSALQILQEQRLNIPLIVVGGPNNAEQAVLAMKRGAADYVPRQRIGSLGLIAANAIANTAQHLRRDSLAQALANSQYRKKAILKAAPDAILTFDGDGRIVEANPAADLLFANGKLVGNRLSDVIMASSLLSDTNEWTTWLAADENPLLGKYVEINAIRKDGRTFPAEVSMVRIPASTPALSTCFIRDISARKQLEAEALGRQTTTLEAVINSMADGVVVADNQGRIMLMNPAGEAMVGLGATDAPSQEWPMHFGLFRPDGKTPLPANEVPLWRALLGEAQDEVEVFVRNARLPEGTLLSVNARPIVYGTGPVLGAVAVFRDITHRRRAEEMLRKSEEQFRKLFEEDLTGNFIATAEGKITAFNPAFVRMFGHHANNGHLDLNVAALFRNPESWQE